MTTGDVSTDMNGRRERVGAFTIGGRRRSKTSTKKSKGELHQLVRMNFVKQKGTELWCETTKRRIERPGRERGPRRESKYIGLSRRGELTTGFIKEFEWNSP